MLQQRNTPAMVQLAFGRRGVRHVCLPKDGVPQRLEGRGDRCRRLLGVRLQDRVFRTRFSAGRGKASVPCTAAVSAVAAASKACGIAYRAAGPLEPLPVLESLPNSVIAGQTSGGTSARRTRRRRVVSRVATREQHAYKGASAAACACACFICGSFRSPASWRGRRRRRSAAGAARGPPTP